MAKKESVFVCQQCGNEYPKWMGQCGACKAWNSLIEVPVARSFASGRGSNVSRGPAQKPIKAAEVSHQEVRRFSTGIEELDRVFGHSQQEGTLVSGIVPGSVALFTGEPGMG